MVNRVEVLDVPLLGRGFTRKARGGAYGPGEFRNMRNCETLADGTIRNRRPIRAIPQADEASNSPITANMRNIKDFVGHYRSSAVSGGNKCHKWYGSYGTKYGAVVKNLWSPATMNALNHSFDPGVPGPAGAGGDSTKIVSIATDWRQVVGFFKYNKICYWIVQSYIAARVTEGNAYSYYHILYAPEPLDGDLTTITFGSLTVIQMFAEDLTSTDTAPSTTIQPTKSRGVFPRFKGFFIFKDRLWVYTQKTIYFSKATDPSIWATPDGGFFNFNEDEVNCCSAYRDTIYIVCDNSVYALTYSTDPNSVTGTVLRKLTDGQGGDSCVLFRDTVYFARDDGLFSVSDQTVVKVRELDFYHDTSTDPPPLYSWKLVVFGNYIIAMARQLLDVRFEESSTNFPVTVSSEWDNIPNLFESTITEGFSLGSDLEDETVFSVFFINMDNGSVHVFDSTAYGKIQDMYFNPLEDEVTGTQQLFIMYTWGPYLVDTVNGSGHWAYYMSVSQDDVVEGIAFDTIFDVNFAEQIVGYVVDLEFWVDVDGDEFYVKRFRQILMEGVFCFGMKIAFSYDNEDYTIPVAVSSASLIGQVPPVKPPYQMRLSMNQKARVVAVRVYKSWVDILDTPFSDDNLSYLMLTKINLLWGGTSRAPQRSYGVNTKD